MRRTIVVAAIVVGCLALAACATQPDMGTAGAPGFLFGLLHGLIAPFTLIAGLFYKVRVYAYPNIGWWYDAGFVLGMLCWGGGAASYR